MQTDAIHEDVSTAGSEEGSADQAVNTPILSDREQAMLDITQQLNEQEISAGFGDPVGVVPAAAAAVMSSDTLVKVKVDGVEVELPLADVTKGYQKDAVASKRLQEAAAERRKLAEWEETLKAREAALVAGKQSVSPPTEDRRELLRAYNAAMLEGDEEEQSLIFDRLLGNDGRQQTTQPVIDEDALLAKAEARLEGKKEWSDFLAAHPAFADDGSEERIEGDLRFLTVYEPKVRAGELSYREALDRTAADVARLLAPAPSARQQKEERKARIDNLPFASGARATAPTAKPPTTEDVIERMRRERGQPV